MGSLLINILAEIINLKGCINRTIKEKYKIVLYLNDVSIMNKYRKITGLPIINKLLPRPTINNTIDKESNSQTEHKQQHIENLIYRLEKTPKNNEYQKE